jgi:hypothetical protein
MTRSRELTVPPERQSVGRLSLHAVDVGTFRDLLFADPVFTIQVPSSDAHSLRRLRSDAIQRVSLQRMTRLDTRMVEVVSRVVRHPKFFHHAT